MAVLAVGAGIVAALAVRDAIAAKGKLVAARALLSDAERDAATAPLAQTDGRLAQALALVRQAEGRVNGVPLRVLGRIPVVGRSARGAQGLTAASRFAIEAAEAAVRAGRIFEDAEGKLHLGLTRGSIDVAAWNQAATTLRIAESRVADARAHLARTPTSWMLDALQGARTDLVDATARLERQIWSGIAGVALAPRMLGGHGERRYLIVFQNLAESRGTGGLIGGFALLHTRGGDIDLEDVSPNTDLRRPTEPVDAPLWYRERYDRHSARQHWSNVNLEPDFRVTGPVIASLFEKTNGQRVDGVISIDPLGLAELLRVTGPVDAPGGVRMTAENVAKLMMYDAYVMFPQSQGLQRKQLFGAAASVVFRRILAGVDERRLLEAVARAGRSNHVFAWSRVAEEQRALERLGGAGVFIPDGSRLFAGVVVQNAGANKLDYFLTRSMSVAARARRNGDVIVDLVVRLGNTLPESEANRFPYVADPPVPDLRGGDNKVWVSVYLPPPASVPQTLVDGRARRPEADASPNATIYSHFAIVPRGGEAVLTYRWTQPRSVSVSGIERSIAFDLPHQATVRPDAVTFRFQTPTGYHLEADGSTSLSRSVRANRPLSFEPVFVRRLWGRLADWLF